MLPADDHPDTKNTQPPNVAKHPEVLMLWRALTGLDLAGTPDLQPHAERFFGAFATVVARFEDHAKRNLDRYKHLQLPAIAAAATVPPLVALNLGIGTRLAAAALGTYVAASTGIEAFLASGRRWRHNRGNAELLKTEGWMYVALAGPYADFHPADHAGGFRVFAERVVDRWQGEIEEYVQIVAAAARRSEEQAAGRPPDRAA